MKTSHLPRSKNIPSVVLIKQHFSVPKEADVREATVRELKKLFPDTTAIKGKIVGLTCPSRGIRDIAQVLITAVSFLKPHCKEVRILTAMGTHGGGTLCRLSTQAAHRAGEMEASRAEAIIKAVAGHHGKEVTRTTPLLEGELPLDGSRFAGQLPPVVHAPTFAIRGKAVAIFSLEQYVETGIMTAQQCAAICDAIVKEVSPVAWQ